MRIPKETLKAAALVCLMTLTTWAMCHCVGMWRNHTWGIVFVVDPIERKVIKIDNRTGLRYNLGFKGEGTDFAQAWTFVLERFPE